MKFLLLLTATTPLILAGCISHEETVYQDAPRTGVQFENDTAARTFYEALSRRSTPASESSTEVNLPIVFQHKRQVKSGPNADFNAAVAAADTNHDGTITEAESRIFSENRPK